MKITRINHAALNVPAGVEDMERFYTGLLGIPTVPRDIPPEFAARIPGFWLQLGETQLHVIQAELKGVAREPTGRHIAFYVEDLEAAVATLAAEGVAHDRFGGVVFLADPGGNTIELQQDPRLAGA
ncbi:MAG: VOC family protein [Gammaproteobacteria bacterium]|jgi:catechol 2,3-dioxygenase-like lactoylglutathione lyase family enzyme|nr:VOC family protein [Gammaproteobacteria bacterium]